MAMADESARIGESPPAGPATVPAPYPPAISAWYTIGMLALINMLDNIDRGIISLLIEPIKRDLGLSDTEIGVLTGIAFSGFYAVVGLPMSRLADTSNRKYVLSFGVMFWSLATAAGAIAQNFWHLFFSRGGTGAGESLKGPNALSMISDLVPREKLPTAMSLYTFGITGGMAFSMILGGGLLALYDGVTLQGPFGLEMSDWHLVFLTVGLPGLLVGVLFLATVKEPVRRNRESKEKPKLLDVFRFLGKNYKFYLFFLLGTAMLQIEMLGMLNWRFPFYERTYGWTAATAGPLLGVLTLISTPIGLMLGAWVGERMAKSGDPGSMMKLSIIGLMLSLPLTIVYPLMPSPWLAAGIAACASICSGISVPGTNSAIQIVTPNEYRGQVSAIYLFTISVIGTALAPLAIALVTDFLFADESMLRYSMVTIAVVFGLLGLAMKLIALKPYTRRVAEIFEQEKAGAA